MLSTSCCQLQLDMRQSPWHHPSVLGLRVSVRVRASVRGIARASTWVRVRVRTRSMAKVRFWAKPRARVSFRVRVMPRVGFVLGLVLC